MHDTMSVLQPLAGNQELLYPLDVVHSRYVSGQWRIPAFQREFVWSDRQIREWALSLTEGMALGQVNTYQPRSEEQAGYAPVYVADGRQRLEATRRFIDDPGAYGFDFDSEGALRIAQATTMPVQHKILADHDAGYLAFQRLNSGTAVEPADFYRGEVTAFPHGKALYRAAIAVLDAAAKDLCKPIRVANRGSYERDSLLQFYQFVTGSTAHQWGNATARSVHARGIPAERRMAELLRERPYTSLRHYMGAFQQWTRGRAALMRRVLDDTRSPNARISTGLMSCLLHALTYGRNVGRDEGWAEQVLMVAFIYSPLLNTQIILSAANTGGTDETFNLSADGLSQLNTVLERVGIAM